MSNMSHCRFENTYKDLSDCKEALDEAGSIQEVQKDANRYEFDYVRKLVELCKEIVDQYESDLDEPDYEDDGSYSDEGDDE